MAQGTFYKTFGSSDRTTTRTLLHESIPITASIVSGTYNDENIRTYTHGMFQSVYDYPFLSSSANHIFDITVGVRSGSVSHYNNLTSQKDKKANIYSQMAQVLMGYDATGSVRPFDADGDLEAGEKIENAYFFNFSRLLVKDEIKKGSFSMEFGANGAFSNNGTYADSVILSDTNGANSYFVNSPAGEYGIVNATRGSGTAVENITQPVGLLFYQAGILALTASFLSQSQDTAGIQNITASLVSDVNNEHGSSFDSLLTASTIGTTATALRNRIINMSFNNTTELNSSIYFCRANHNEFNYSSNPSYLTGSKIRVKNNDIMVPPRSYVTTVGLYSADNELLAVAKLSEPLRKDPTNELTLRVRLDY